MTRVAIIGAGAGGLAMARRLDEAGIESTVFEAGSHVGGLWVLDNDNGFAQAYDSLHINSESAITAFEGFPFESGTPIYPSHDTMARYFDAFARHFGILPRIRFNSPVSSISPVEGGWQVTCASGDSETYSDVVVASGHQNYPSHPAWVEKFEGRYLHSRDYRVPGEFSGQRVLVVGVGNSALDIAADICTVTSTTVLSARSPVLILPRMAFGIPTSRILGRVERPYIPWPVNRRIRELICWATHGRMERWGFTTPKTRTHPTSHPTLVHHMEWRRGVGKPGVTAVEGRMVTFADGTSEEFDVVIGGTGYEVLLPFLPPDLVPTRGRELDLYRRIVIPGRSGLYFLGLFNVSGGANVPVLDHQAKWIAAALQGGVQLPGVDQMRQAIRAEQNRIAYRYPGGARYGLEVEPRRYLPALEHDRTDRKARGGPSTR